MVDPISLSTVIFVCKAIGTVFTLCGAAFGAFSVINWIKSKLTNIDTNLIELKHTFNTAIQGLRDDTKSQTITIASALGEQRSDFRTFYGPTLLMLQRQAPQDPRPFADVPVEVPALARAKKTPVKRNTKKVLTKR
jgi:hypothetical protein